MILRFVEAKMLIQPSVYTCRVLKIKEPKTEKVLSPHIYSLASLQLLTHGQLWRSTAGRFTRRPRTPRRPDWSGSSAARTSPCPTPPPWASHEGCSSSGTSWSGTSDTWREVGRFSSLCFYECDKMCIFLVFNQHCDKEKIIPVKHRCCLTFWRTAFQMLRWFCSSCGRPGRRYPGSPSFHWPLSSLWGRFPIEQSIVMH